MVMGGSTNPTAIAHVQTTDRNVNQLQQNISQAVNPVISNAITQGTILSNQTLNSGSTTIQTKLNKQLTGWLIIRQRGSATVYDNQDSNNQKSTSLILVSSAQVSVDLYVF